MQSIQRELSRIVTVVSERYATSEDDDSRNETRLLVSAMAVELLRRVELPDDMLTTVEEVLGQRHPLDNHSLDRQGGLTLTNLPIADGQSHGTAKTVPRHIADDAESTLNPSDRPRAKENPASNFASPPPSDPTPAASSQTTIHGATAETTGPLSPIPIQHVMEGRIIVLMPTAEEYVDRARLVQSAIDLGAEGVGMFKIKKPEGIPGMKSSQPPQAWSGFEYAIRKAKGERTYRVKRVPSDVVIGVGGEQPVQDLQRGTKLLSPDFETAGEAMQQFQDIVEKTSGSSGSRAWKTWYGPELSGTDPSVRSALGLHESCPIYPLSDSALNRSLRKYDGLHTPWLYLAGHQFGSPFALHKEDGDLYSFNIVHAGRPKIWTFFPKSVSKSVEQLVMDNTRCKKRACTQFVRHASCFLPPALLDQSGIPHCQVQQRAGEVVVTLPGVYHQGFNTGNNLAEAINYWVGEYDPGGYVDCVKGVCVKTAPVTTEGLLPPSDSVNPRKRKRVEREGDNAHCDKRSHSEEEQERCDEVDMDQDSASEDGRRAPTSGVRGKGASPTFAEFRSRTTDDMADRQAKKTPKARTAEKPSLQVKNKKSSASGNTREAGNRFKKLGRPTATVDWHEYEARQREKCAKLEIELSIIRSPASLLKELLGQAKKKPIAPKTADIIARLVMAFGSSEAFSQLKAAITSYREADIGMPKLNICPESVRDILTNIENFESATSLFGIMRRVRLYQLHRLFNDTLDKWDKDTTIEGRETVHELNGESSMESVKAHPAGTRRWRLNVETAKKKIPLKQKKTLVLEYLLNSAYPHLKQSKGPAELEDDPSASHEEDLSGEAVVAANHDFHGQSENPELPSRPKRRKLPKNSKAKGPYIEQRDILKRRIESGKPWWLLVQRYGIAILGLLPSHGELQVSSAMLEVLSVPDFKEFMNQLALQKDCFLSEVCAKLKVLGELMLLEGGVKRLPTLVLENLNQDQILQQPDSSPSFVRFCAPVEGFVELEDGTGTGSIVPVE